MCENNCHREIQAKMQVEQESAAMKESNTKKEEEMDEMNLSGQIWNQSFNEGKHTNVCDHIDSSSFENLICNISFHFMLFSNQSHQD